MKNITVLLFVMMLANFCMAQAPINDDCGGAIALTPSAGLVSVTGTDSLATQSLPATCTGVNTADDDVWYSFSTSAVVGQPYTITVVPSASFDAVFQVFSGNCGTLTNVTCVNSTAVGGSETATLVALTTSTTYWIRVYDAGVGYPATPTFTISINTPPLNDNCPGTTLTPGVICTSTVGSLAGATPSGVAATCGGTPDDDVWYNFTAASTTEIITVTPCATMDAVIQVFSGSCAGTSIICTNLTGTGIPETVTASGLTVGTTYWIRVYDFTGAPACTTFGICITSPPVNDECTGAIVLTPGLACTTTAGTDAGATASPVAATSCGGSANDDVWYSFVAASASGMITVAGCASFNAVVALYSGTCGALTYISCVNAIGAGGTETLPLTTLIPGTVYYIRVYDFAAGYPACNTFTICVTSPACTSTAANVGPNVSLPCGSTMYSWISTPSGPTVQSYTWMVSSGETIIAGAGTNSITVAFVASGSPYMNSVMVVDTGVCGTTTYDTMYINVATPGINYTIVPDSTNPYNYTFFNSTPGTILSYSWDFGDGSAISTLASPSHTYSTTGTYNVCLSVNTSLCSGSLCDSVNVTGVTNACNALFNVAHDTASSNPNGYIVTNLSYGASLSYAWDFGDGTFAYVPHPTHTYPAIGPYQLCLNVNDGMGCNSNYCDSIYAVDSLHTHLHPIQITVVGAGSSTTVGVANADDAGEWLISPNPSAGVFQVSNTKQKIKEIKVFDVLGKEILATSPNNNQSTINISQYSKGIYFVKITDEKKNVVNRKIVVQ